MTFCASSWAWRISDRLRTLKSSSWYGCRRWRWRSSSRSCTSASAMSSPVRILTEIACTARGLELLLPSTFFLAVESGISRMSSWSWPHEFCPLRSSTPITVNGTFLMRTI